ncbi:hypothetical protein [Vibrio penaeicida]|nr:hypothetical protein [Vibrio penaeicida]RTZ22087.1 hypothetical protein EKN09_16060 [Vibrio penaeicida]
MAAEFWFNDSGTQRKAKEIYFNDSGTLRKAKEIWYNDNGTMRRVFNTDSSLRINIQTQNVYNMFYNFISGTQGRINGQSIFSFTDRLEVSGTYFILAIGGRTTDNQCLLRVSTSSNGSHTKIGSLNSVRVRFGAQSTVLSWANNTLQYEVISSELTNYLKSSVSSANPMIIEKV